MHLNVAVLDSYHRGFRFWLSHWENIKRLMNRLRPWGTAVGSRVPGPDFIQVTKLHLCSFGMWVVSPVYKT